MWGSRERWAWWQTGACISACCPAHYPQPQVSHGKKWKLSVGHTHLGPESALGLPLFGCWSKMSFFVCCRFPTNILSLLSEFSWTMRRYCLKLLLCYTGVLTLRSKQRLVALHSFWQERVLSSPLLVLFLSSIFMVLKKSSLRFCQWSWYVLALNYHQSSACPWPDGNSCKIATFSTLTRKLPFSVGLSWLYYRLNFPLKVRFRLWIPKQTLRVEYQQLTYQELEGCLEFCCIELGFLVWIDRHNINAALEVP